MNRYLILQFTMKYLLFVDLRKMVKIIDGIRAVYFENSQPTDAYYGICQRFVRITEYTIKIIIFGYVMVMVGTLLFGTFDAILSNERQPFMYCYLPKIRNYSNNFFYTLVSIYNTGILALATITIAPNDVICALIIVNAPMVPAMVQVQMDQLSSELRKKAPIDSAGIQRCLIRYLKMHQEYNE